MSYLSTLKANNASDWFDLNGWHLVNCGVYTQEEYSDPHPYYGIELDRDPETGVELIRFGKFVNLVNQLDTPFIEFQNDEQMISVIENFRLAIGIIKLAESDRPCLGVIRGGKS